MDQLIWRVNFHTPFLIWSVVYTYLKAMTMKWLRYFMNLAPKFLKYTKKDFKSSYIKWVIEYVVVTWVFVIIFSTFALLGYEWKIAGGEFRNLYFKFNTSNMYWGDMKWNFTLKKYQLITYITVIFPNHRLETKFKEIFNQFKMKF